MYGRRCVHTDIRGEGKAAVASALYYTNGSTNDELLLQLCFLNLRNGSIDDVTVATLDEHAQARMLQTLQTDDVDLALNQIVLPPTTWWNDILDMDLPHKMDIKLAVRNVGEIRARWDREHMCITAKTVIGWAAMAPVKSKSLQRRFEEETVG